MPLLIKQNKTHALALKPLLPRAVCGLIQSFVTTAGLPEAYLKRLSRRQLSLIGDSRASWTPVRMPRQSDTYGIYLRVPLTSHNATQVMQYGDNVECDRIPHDDDSPGYHEYWYLRNWEETSSGPMFHLGPWFESKFLIRNSFHLDFHCWLEFYLPRQPLPEGGELKLNPPDKTAEETVSRIQELQLDTWMRQQEQ